MFKFKSISLLLILMLNCSINAMDQVDAVATHEFDKNKTEESIRQKLQHLVQALRHRFGDNKIAAWLRKQCSAAWKSVIATSRSVSDIFQTSPVPINQTPTEQKISKEITNL